MGKLKQSNNRTITLVLTQPNTQLHIDNRIHSSINHTTPCLPLPPKTRHSKTPANPTARTSPKSPPSTSPPRTPASTAKSEPRTTPPKPLSSMQEKAVPSAGVIGDRGNAIDNENKYG